MSSILFSLGVHATEGLPGEIYSSIILMCILLIFCIVAKIKAQDIIVEAQKTAENEKNKIINATKEEVRNLKIAADKDIEESRRRAKDDIKREIIDVAFQASEKILQREINEDDNEKVLNNFIDSLNEEEK